MKGDKGMCNHHIVPIRTCGGPQHAPVQDHYVDDNELGNVVLVMIT